VAALVMTPLMVRCLGGGLWFVGTRDSVFAQFAALDLGLQSSILKHCSVMTMSGGAGELVMGLYGGGSRGFALTEIAWLVVPWLFMSRRES
jgi:hypothetical protein